MTTAPLTDRLVVRSRLVQGGTDLLDMLPSPRGVLSWVQAGEGLVAWGEVARVCTEGPHRFARAQHWWQSFCAQLDTRDEVGLPGSGPVAFASLAFDDSPGSSVLVVPRVVVGRRGDRSWVTEFATGVATRPVRPVSRPCGLRYVDGQLPVTAWRDTVARAVSRQALRPFCTELVVPTTPSVLQLHNVLHLATEVRGTLHPSGPPLLTLADAVHPTAAVGGTPTPDAISAISELEAMDRGRYAGPVGWIDATGNSERHRERRAGPRAAPRSLAASPGCSPAAES